ncbi:MAG: hypothetical protein KL787_05335 [Taibaiella sp.]|nr:hypothetical protein [Taibaiella sp.]
MNITVEYIDQTGVVHNQIHRLTRLALAKHLAIAGQGYAPRLHKFRRMLSMFFHYSPYLQRQAFDSDRFSEPPIHLSDPTEKGQFSNLVGKAIADFLSKRIDQSIYTVNYEAAMRMRKMSLKVGRPDLLAFTQNAMFAIEAKGYSGGHGNMIKHKAQSQTGGIPVNFTVACVSYDLYSNVKCNYHDPFNENIQYDNEILNGLTRNYYRGLLTFLDRRYFDYREYEIQEERFYEIQLNYRTLEKLFPNDFPFRPLWYSEFFEYHRLSLLLPIEIRDYATNGITRDFQPFLFDTKQESNYIYIDNDRVGLRIRQ